MFLAILGMCETNAMKAYRHHVGPITRYEWLVQLSDKLINNPYLEGVEEEAGPSTRAGPSTGRQCGNLEYTNHQTKCSACG